MAEAAANNSDMVRVLVLWIMCKMTKDMPGLTERMAEAAANNSDMVRVLVLWIMCKMS
jgi:hypothetical protein